MSKSLNLRSSLILIALLPVTLLQAQRFTIEKTPAWVKPIELPYNNSQEKYDVLSGYYPTLVDYQANLAINSFYNREVLNIVSYGGITNASQLSVTYDSSYQKLRIHHLIIWRKGKKIDRTHELSFEIMNNEQNLQQGLYMGVITAYDILNDIRKDDKIDFAYSLTGANPIFENEKYIFVPLASMNPIDKYAVRIIYPKDKNYQYTCTGCDSTLTDTIADGNRQIEIMIPNLRAFEMEDQIPSWIIPYNYFALSSMKSWKAVNTWAQRVFALPEKPDLNAVFQEVFNGKETTEEKLNTLINYVQDDIRYMGIETGIGSIKPFPPEQVVKKRFGDCKDKSLLLVSLLKQIGIDKAYPALVNTTMKQNVDDPFPSNQVFNHCIVTFTYHDSVFWVDPTIALQGGDFRTIYNTDHGKALIIGLPSDTLYPMNLVPIDSRAEIIEEFTIPSFSEPAKLKITSNRYGIAADMRRADLEYHTSKALSDAVSDELKMLFPVVNKSDELIIADDMDKNKITVTYNYEVDSYWQDGDKASNDELKGYWVFRFEPLTLYSYLEVSPCKDRIFDFAMAHPSDIHYRVIFHFPKDILIQDDYDLYDNVGFTFEEKTEQLNSRTLQIDYILKTKTYAVKAADYKKVCEQKNKITKSLPVVIYFSK